jgi:hypothetical protein
MDAASGVETKPDVRGPDTPPAEKRADVALDKLLDAVDHRLDAQARTSPSSSGTNVRSTATRLYEAARLPNQGTIDTFKTTRPARLAYLIAECVAIEGPVHLDRVMRLVAESFGIHRVGHLISRSLRAALAYAPATTSVERRGDFLWPREPRALAVRGPDAIGWVRPVREVPLEEIALAAQNVLEVAFALHRDDLIIATARSLGYDRTGTLVQSVVCEVIDELISHGALTSIGDQVRRSAEVAVRPDQTSAEFRPTDVYGEPFDRQPYGSSACLRI